MSSMVSVIIPVYKIENQIKKCVNSVLNQTYKKLEIILVDDGSPDKCPEMCDDFAKKDPRVKVIHKENEGVSVARNIGIDSATGEYIVFVDGDDWLPKNSVENLVSAIEHTNSDFAMGAIKWVAFLSFKMQHGIDKQVFYTDVDNLVSFLECINPGPCGKIYKSQIIREANIRFPSGIKYGEDRVFLWKYIKNCNKLYSFSKVVYYYNRLVLESATTRYFPQMHSWYKNCMENLVEILEQHFDLQVAKDFLTKTILEGMVFALKYHVFGNKDSEKTIEPLMETWELFMPLLTDARYIQKDILSKNLIFDLCKKQDFKRLYNLLIQEKPKENFLRKLKTFIKEILIKIKRVMFFGI